MMMCAGCNDAGKDGEYCRTSSHPDFEALGACNAGLVCTNGRCAQPTPAPSPPPPGVACPNGLGNLDCPCVGGACNNNLECGADQVCREKVCPIETSGCECGAGGSCTQGLRCDSTFSSLRLITVLLSCEQVVFDFDLLSHVLSLI